MLAQQILEILKKYIKSKFSLKLLSVLLFVFVKKYTTVQKFGVSLFLKEVNTFILQGHIIIIIIIFSKVTVKSFVTKYNNK